MPGIVLDAGDVVMREKHKVSVLTVGELGTRQ